MCRHSMFFFPSLGSSGSVWAVWARNETFAADDRECPSWDPRQANSNQQHPGTPGPDFT